MITEAIIASVIAGTTVCSDHFENVSRYMPQELSEYQQCVYTARGEEAGTVGRQLWFQLDGKFFYVPIKELADKDPIAANKIITEVVMEREYQTYTDEQIREFAVEAAAKVDSPVVTVGVTHNGLNSGYHGAKTLTTEAGQTLVFIDADLSDSVRGNRAQWSDFNADINIEVHSDHVKMYVDGAGGELPYIRNVIGSDHFSNAQRHAISDIIAQVSAEVYQLGYNDGYADGYADGYTDGYAQGFADGVASAK